MISALFRVNGALRAKRFFSNRLSVATVLTVVLGFVCALCHDLRYFARWICLSCGSLVPSSMVEAQSTRCMLMLEDLGLLRLNDSPLTTRCLSPLPITLCSPPSTNWIYATQIMVDQDEIVEEL